MRAGLHFEAGGADRGFAGRLELFGAAVAVVTSNGETVSYAALAERADAFAARLAGARLLLIEARNELKALVAYLGALRSGTPAILTSSGGDHAALAEVFAPDAIFAPTDGGWRLERRARRDIAPHPDLALLLSTSGTTGATKLVRLSTHNLEANATSIAAYLEIAASDRAITSLPFHYSYGLSVVNSHLAQGASLILTDRSVVSPEFWGAFAAHGATSLAGVPHTFELLERGGFRKRAFPSLRTITQAGGRLPPALVRTYADWSRERGVRFYVMYGQTEATARMAYLPPEHAASHPDCVGVAIPGGCFRLEDPQGQPIEAPDVVGELVYAGPNVMMGYALGADDLGRGPELDELRTGDLACRTPEGLYRIAGRKSRFAKIFGLRVALDQVETKMAELGAPGVAVSDDAAVHLAITAKVDGAEVVRALAQACGLPETVFRIAHWTELPRLPSGKVDYPAVLRRATEEAAAPAEPRAAGDTILSAFARAFPRATINPEDSFVGLGGDSLNYVTISLALEEALGDLPENWENLSVGELRALSRRATTRGPWRMRGIETEVVIRAAAILAVVTTHASTLPVGGGAEVLLVLAGYNMARYQRARLAAGDGWSVVLPFLQRVIAPYYALLVAFTLLAREFDLPSFLLVSNFFGRFGSSMEPYWFLEVLLQLMLCMALLARIGPVRRVIGQDSWRFGLTALAALVLLRMASQAAFDHTAVGARTPDAVGYLLMLGWCLQEARSPSRRRIMTAVVGGLAVVGVFGIPVVWPAVAPPSNLSHIAWLTALTAALLWAPRLSLPAPIHRAVSSIAAASFYIYLSHVIPVWLFYWHLGWRSLPLNLGVSVGLGLAVWQGFNLFDAVRSGRTAWPWRRKRAPLAAAEAGSPHRS
ncbi:AMP-binding protein [Phenylobacterium sp.]|uniref:AMP-binding protein n=1 Tax=Phenylobacterium sp. TaxID=1871053 RepID=UPI0025DB58B9|nr:AMP-binding protein [Phenylobacterium sp.]